MAVIVAEVEKQVRDELEAPRATSPGHAIRDTFLPGSPPRDHNNASRMLDLPLPLEPVIRLTFCLARMLFGFARKGPERLKHGVYTLY